METTVVNGLGRLVHDDGNDDGTIEQRKRIEQFVHLERECLVTNVAPQSGEPETYHGVRAVRIRGPDVPLHEQRPEI